MALRFARAVAALPIALACGLALGEDTNKVGKVTFPTSCDPKVQAQFERGVAMLHSFWFIGAKKTFEGVLAQDPGCAIAYWGIAMDLLRNPLAFPPPPEHLPEAWAALEKAREVGAKTPRERAWIEAISAYYRDYDKLSVDERMLRYTKAMEQLTQQYPNDFEAKIYYALALQASASPSDRAYSNQLKSAAILEKLFLADPEHPGIAHYLIHAYDFPPIAEKGLPAARRYAGLAPAASHARHMPSHIYSMLGLWEDSIASNLYSMEIQPDYYHAADFIVYAQLQLAQDQAARAMIGKALNTADTGTRYAGVAGETALAAMPARYMLERADWKGAAQLPVYKGKFPAAEAISRFARGLGMARTGDLAGTEAEMAALEQLKASLKAGKQPYWADRVDEQLTTLAAWLSYARGEGDKALKLMRTAADGEDASVKNVAMENRLYPMRELLGEMLLASKQPKLALREFEASLRETPNRLRAYYGASVAAKEAGDQQAAETYMARLVILTKKADSVRPDLTRAR
ncbi:MAG: hypothetical protein JO035_09435, partial [Betaproteobacteria bacterium]|nr:hypothetical protein [Betaproteobacteria bacterium]